jgi:hypothetical protein
MISKRISKLTYYFRRGKIITIAEFLDKDDDVFERG